MKRQNKRTFRRPVKAAESYGWVVESWEAQEAYEFACERLGKEYVDEEIIQGLSTDELAESLAYLFRMNEFDEWYDYKGGDVEASTRRSGRSVMADSTRSAEASLYNRLMKAVPNPDTDVDTYESDLYVLKTPETTKILKDYYDRIGVSFQATTFKDPITHRTYYDVPFGYMNEFVEKRRRGLD